jgi:8-oxo-dGTP pyrophosphatase MutT (NUDIX family)
MKKADFFSRFQQALPGESAHDAFAPYRKNFESQAEAIRKKAAVGIHFYQENDDWYFLLIERSTYDGKHSAQMAFPGGKPEESDPHLEFTARRESEEELSIPISQGAFVGQLTNVWIPVSSFEVSPFVFYHDTKPSIVLNAYEVANCYSIRLHDLLAEESVSKTTIKVNDQFSMKDIPCFVLNEKIVWGATALMLNELKLLLKKT